MTARLIGLVAPSDEISGISFCEGALPLWALPVQATSLLKQQSGAEAKRSKGEWQWHQVSKVA